MTTFDVDATNANQAAAWDGGEGRYWAARAERFDRSVRTHHERMMARAAIRADEHVLDIGCGNGETSCDAARAARPGDVLGVDLSAAMLEVARQRASSAGLANVDFVQADAQVHPFSAGAFDIVIGRCVAMFFGDQPAAFANLARALRDGGRLVLLTWQDVGRIEWFREFMGALAAGRDLPTPPPGAPHPFSLADPGRVRGLLGDAGFVDVELEPSEAPMWFGEDVDDAQEFVLGLLGWMLRDLDDGARHRAVEDLRRSLDGHRTEAGVTYESAAWIVSARTPPRG